MVDVLMARKGRVHHDAVDSADFLLRHVQKIAVVHAIGLLGQIPLHVGVQFDAAHTGGQMLPNDIRQLAVAAGRLQYLGCAVDLGHLAHSLGDGARRREELILSLQVFHFLREQDVLQHLRHIVILGEDVGFCLSVPLAAHVLQNLVDLRVSLAVKLNTRQVKQVAVRSALAQHIQHILRNFRHLFRPPYFPPAVLQ